MEKEQKENLIKIIITIFLFIIVKIIEKRGMVQEKIVPLLYVMPYILIGYKIIFKALINIKNKKPFDECFLMTVATLGAFLIGEYSEAVFTMLFYQIGEFFGDFAVDKSEKSMRELINLRPDTVMIEGGEKISSKEAKIGDVIIVNNGDRIPLDGEVIEGTTMLDTSSLSGESIPRQVKIGDEVLSGTINIDSTIKIKVTKNYDESTATKIIELVENASEKKSKSEKFITEFARIYTPVVCFLAFIVFALPAIFEMLILKRPWMIKNWFYRALTLLVISCPCALVVSIPLAFFSSIGKASRKGILIKGSNFLETIAHIKTIVFDKTGTMTKGVFEVVGVHNEESIERDHIIEKAAYVEFFSNHPIAKCIKKEYGKKIDAGRIKDCREMGGQGIFANVDGKKIFVGSAKLMIENHIEYKPCEHVGTIVHVAEDYKYLGHIVIADRIKDESKSAINKLKEIGVEKTVLLTGDLKDIGEYVAKEIDVDEVYTELLPEDKVNKVEKLIKENKSTEKKLAFVGDGINDAAALVRADIGISMGAIGSDSAVEASDVVLMDDNPEKVYEVIKISKKTMLVNYEIIIFTLLIKIIFIVLSVCGISNMWFATFADVGVLIICVLNAIRLLI